MTSPKGGSIFVAFPIAMEDIAIIPVITVGIWLPPRQSAEVVGWACESYSDVAIATAADDLLIDETSQSAGLLNKDSSY